MEELTTEEKLKYFNTMEAVPETNPEFFKYDVDVPAIAEEASKHQGRPLGFDTLDMLTGGVSSGELVVVTAKTGVGKTTLCQSISWELAHKGHPVLWYTLEVGLMNFIQPFIQNDAGATYNTAGKLEKVTELPVYFPKDMERLDFKSLKQAIRYAHDKFGVEHVFIDHLSYLVSSKDLNRNGSMSLHIGDKLRDLRRIAIETGVSIFLVAHVTKIEDGKRPSINDLRDSSFIGQEADIVLVLWREKLKNPVIKKVGEVEYEETLSPIVHCAVEKSRRTGKRGVFWLKHDKGLYTEATRRDLDAVSFFDAGE